MSPALKPLLWAAAAAACTLTWQALTVRYNYANNWTALFCTGSSRTIPPALAAERVWVFPNSAGFDGQFYHYIAHDPFLRQGMAEYVDAPRLRYRRILVPLAAFLLAVGRSQAIDIAYAGIVLIFLFLGAYWLGCLAVSFGRSPAWALLFGLTPAALWSMDRMVVDGALLALALAFAWYGRTEEHPWCLYLALVAAGLVRDTGLLLTAAYVLRLLFQRRISRAVQFVSAALPALGWYVYVALRTAPAARGGIAFPFTGILDRILHPVPYPFSPALTLTIRGFDYLALAGILLAFALALRAAPVLWRSPQGMALLLFAAVGIFLWTPGDWGMPIDYSRILSPLLLLLVVEAFRSGEWLAAAPLAMVVPRCLLQLAPQASGVIRGLFGLS